MVPPTKAKLFRILPIPTLTSILPSEIRVDIITNYPNNKTSPLADLNKQS